MLRPALPLARIACLAAALVTTMSSAETPPPPPTSTPSEAPFVLDFLGWDKEAKVTAEQKKIATAYLDAQTEVNQLPKEHKVAQVICLELKQDLVATHRFFHCRLTYEANAVDGGPFDDGAVLAWDGKRALLHSPTQRRDEDPPHLRVTRDGPEPDWRALETITGLHFRTPALWHQPDAKDDAADALEASLNAALSKRATGFAAKSPVTELPGWLSFALAVHFDTAQVEWQPGLPSEQTVKQQFEKVGAGYPSAAKLSKESKREPGFSGTVRFRHGGMYGVFLRFDDPSRGLRFRERTIGYVPAIYG